MSDRRTEDTELVTFHLQSADETVTVKTELPSAVNRKDSAALMLSESKEDVHQPMVDPRLSVGYQRKVQGLDLRIAQSTLSLKQKLTGKVQILPEIDIASLTKDDKQLLETDVHVIPINNLAKRYGSDIQDGLTEQQVNTNKDNYGTNILTPPFETSYVLLFCKQLISGFSGLLWCAACVIFLSWYPIGQLNGLIPQIVNLAVAALLLVVIFTSAIFNFVTELRAYRIIKAFNEYVPIKVRVRRHNEDISIDANDLVVGDIIYLESGIKVPADIRLIQCTDFQVNNSALTGESEPVQCSTQCTNLNFMESNNMIFMATLITQGSGMGIVVATGDQTVIGEISKLTQAGQEDQQTSLHKELNHFVLVVAFAAFCAAIACTIDWAAYIYPQHATFMPVAGYILNLISFIVAFVPEGLPVCVTLTLTMIAKRMFYQKVLIKNLAIIETFNSVSTIATDKTGTLTQNKMSITQIIWGNKRYDVPLFSENGLGSKFSASNIDLLDAQYAKDEVFRLLIAGAGLCNNSYVNSSSTLTRSGRQILGDAADIGLYNLLSESLFIDPEEIRVPCIRIKTLPFNSKNKFMISINQMKNCPIINTPEWKDTIIFMKGAPEIVLDKCNTILVPSGDGYRKVDLNRDYCKQIETQQMQLGKSGLRLIALSAIFTNSEAVTNSSDADFQFPMSGYTFIGMFALLDPPREGVEDSIKKAQGAGIAVYMVTGDHHTTAQAIAKQVHIIPPHIKDEQIYSLQSARDSLDRLLFRIMQNGQAVEDHTIGLNISSAPGLTDEKEEGEDEQKLKEVAVVKPAIKANKAVNESAAVITGNDLKLFDQFMWDWVFTHRYLVFSRTSPEQKLKIVQEAQARNYVVSVTGDGTNDAPALRQSDLGVAMASGTQVAREAGDLVLLDNNFSSVITAIETGRTVSDNLKKVCLYLMVGGTWCEMWSIVGNVFFGLPLPLTSFYMLEISITTDILNALAIVQEKPEQEVMLRKPVNRRENRLVDYKVVLQAYGFCGFLGTFAAYFCQFLYYQHEAGLPAGCLFFAWTWGNGEDFTCSADSSVKISPTDQSEFNFTAQSVYFMALLVFNWCQMFATRTRYSSIFQHNPFYGPGQNLWLFVALAFGILEAIFVTNVHWFNKIFLTRPVPALYILPALGFGILYVILDEIRRYIVRKHPDGFLARHAW